jgi:UDP-glucose 4,6-dehydratase
VAKKIFITGGAGFIGSHISEEMFNTFKKSKIIILDKLTYAGKKIYLKKILSSNRVKFIKGDIRNYNLYKKYLKNVDIAINVAAESHVDNSFKSPISFTSTNTLGAHIFLLNCIENKVNKILHVSSDEVYGEKIIGKCNENQKINPTNPYSASKAAAEIIINSHKFAYKKDIITVRGNNVYGVRQYPEKLIPRCILNLIRNKKIPIHGNGRNLRFYLSAKDFARAISLLVRKKDRGIYNIGSETEFRNIDIAKKICEIFNKNPKNYIKYINDRPYNDKRYSVSTDKIKKLGWQPKDKLINDLPEIIRWYKQNYRLYKNCE